MSHTASPGLFKEESTVTEPGLGIYKGKLSELTDKVVALVPAYNEEDIIENTIDSLMVQSFAFEYILVIANNCKDQTVPIVKRLQREKYGTDKLRLVEMPSNPHLKAGALNYGFKIVQQNDVNKEITLIFGMDSDTVVHHQMIEAGVRRFAAKGERNTGGICSAYRALELPKYEGDDAYEFIPVDTSEGSTDEGLSSSDIDVLIPQNAVKLNRLQKLFWRLGGKKPFIRKKKISAWARFLWRLQNIEFALANAWRIEMYKSARVLPGVSVMYRMEALEDVQRKNILERKSDGPWVVNDRVEDYQLTVDLKDMSWEAKSSHNMISWSDVPLHIFGKGGLWNQRVRWYSGTVDTLRRRKFAKHSRYEVMTIFLLNLTLLMRLALYTDYAILLLSHVGIQFVPIFLLLNIYALGLQMYKLLKYGDQLDKWQILITATLVINDAYSVLREVMYAYSVFASKFRPNRPW